MTLAHHLALNELSAEPMLAVRGGLIVWLNPAARAWLGCAGEVVPFPTGRWCSANPGWDDAVTHLKAGEGPWADAEARVQDGVLLAVVRTGAGVHAHTDERLRMALTAAEDAASAKGAFLAMIGHEIRTPMNGVLGMAELLQNTALTPEQEGLVRTLYRSGEALLALLNDLLDLSRAESGRVELERIPIDPVAIAHDVCDLFLARLDGRPVDLAVDADPGMALPCLGDPLRLRQVLSNLVGNAIKFTERGHVLITLAGEAGGLRLTVSDTGIGIPPERLPHLFTPFTQGDSSTARRYGGSGLGLAISKRLVEQMGGSIAVVSESGSGTTFSVVLPLEAAPGATIAQPTGRQVGLRALVVDGEAWRRRVVVRQLRSCGLIANEASDLASAMMMPGKPDLVLVDISAVSERPAASLAALPPRCVPVLLTSGFHAGDPLAMEAVGWRGMLARPVRRHVLVQVLDEALRRRDSGERRPVTSEEGDPTTVFTPPQSCAGVRVLLVEDQPVNQEVARRMLERLGCLVEVTGDGSSALLRLADGGLDVVLMDVQMPDMDGFETALRWRSQELAHGLPRLPVIALTANADTGDRERCLAAGMDDHLAKPVTSAGLARVLGRWSGAVARVVAVPVKAVADPIDRLQLEDALTAVAGDDLAERRAFLKDASGDLVRRLSEVESAAQAGMASGMARAAHTLKGCLLTLGGTAAAAEAAAVERPARSGDTASASTALIRLRQAVHALVKAFTSM